MAHQQDWLAGFGAAKAGDKVVFPLAGTANKDVVRIEASVKKTLLNGAGCHGIAAIGVRGIDFDQLFQDGARFRVRLRSGLPQANEQDQNDVTRLPQKEIPE
jgi:hypothetical protein